MCRLSDFGNVPGLDPASGIRPNDTQDVSIAVPVALFLAMLALWLLAGCMTVEIQAKEGSTVTVTQTKPVTVTTDAQVPMGALP